MILINFTNGKIEFIKKEDKESLRDNSLINNRVLYKLQIFIFNLIIMGVIEMNLNKLICWILMNTKKE